MTKPVMIIELFYDKESKGDTEKTFYSDMSYMNKLPAKEKATVDALMDIVNKFFLNMD